MLLRKVAERKSAKWTGLLTVLRPWRAHWSLSVPTLLVVGRPTWPHPAGRPTWPHSDGGWTPDVTAPCWTPDVTSLWRRLDARRDCRPGSPTTQWVPSSHCRGLLGGARTIRGRCGQNLWRWFVVHVIAYRVMLEAFSTVSLHVDHTSCCLSQTKSWEAWTGQKLHFWQWSTSVDALT